MPLITDLANAIRKDEPRNLFCLVEFGDHGFIMVSSSGKGWAPKGTHIDIALSLHDASRVVMLNDTSGQNADGEQRLFRDFGYWYEKYGNGTKYVTVITAASPCDKVCANLIREAADVYSDIISNWVVLFHDYYNPDVQNHLIHGVMSKLQKTEHPKITCGLLHSTFVDKSTLYGMRNDTPHEGGGRGGNVLAKRDYRDKPYRY
jgi:hypothetical protein